MTTDSERTCAPAVAVQRGVRHHDEPTMRAMTTLTAAWYDPSTGETVVCASRMKAMENERDQLLGVLNEILECSNGHFNPLFKCKCYEKAHALVMPNDRTLRQPAGGADAANQKPDNQKR